MKPTRDDWKDCLLGDAVTLKRGYDLTMSDRKDGPYPVITSSGFAGFHNEAKVKGPGVVTGRYGTLGEVHLSQTNCRGRMTLISTPAGRTTRCRRTNSKLSPSVGAISRDERPRPHRNPAVHCPYYMKLFPSDTVSRLQACADVAIWQSHQNTAHWSARRNPASKPPEEDYVAAFVLHALPGIAAAWRPLFQQQRVQLSLTGVFCHNTPKAAFKMAGKNESPELADLLIVRRHKDRRGFARQVAVLVQAKMSDTGQIKLPKNDPQLYLYTNWPEFKLLARQAPPTQFCLGRDAQQSVYAGISEETPNIPNNIAWAGFCPWAMMPARQQGWVEEPLSVFLLKLLNFEAGREFFDIGAAGCHWSELIHFLLKTTFCLPLRTRDMRLADPRGMTVSMNRMAFMSADARFTSAFVPSERLEEIMDGGEGEPPLEREPQFEDGGEGRVLLVETSEAEG